MNAWDNWGGIFIKGGTQTNGVNNFAISPALQQTIDVNLPKDYPGGTIATGAVAGDLAKITLMGEGSTGATAKLVGTDIVVTVPQSTCTCTVSAPTFAGGSIVIPHDAATATQNLSATGATLGGNCTSSGHTVASVTYAYTEKTDDSNIATVSGTTLTVTGAGTVVVTATASINGKSASTDATFTVTKQPAPVVSYTVTFDSQSATTAASPATKTVTTPATTVDALPTPPVKTSYIFGGWFTAVSGGGTEFIVTTPVNANITLYAKWTPVFNVGGDITDNGGGKVDGATVTIKLGNTEMGRSTTDVNGAFTIGGIPNGVYQLIIASGDLTVTKTITVADGDLAVGTVTLPAGKQNSVVDVKPDTPDVVVGGLDEQFEETATEDDKGITPADKAVIAASGEVEIKLTVESKTDTAPNAAEIIQAAGGKTLAFLDLSVKKTVTPSGGNATETTLTELQKLLEVRIPLSNTQQGKTDYVIYRYHGTAVDTITTNANIDGEKIRVVGTTLILTVKKFSTYAIAYSETVTPPPPVDSGSGVTTYAITATAGEGGSISPSGRVSVAHNSSKVFTFTPNAGYEIVDVLVDGKSVGAVTTYTFEKVTAKHTIEAQFRKLVENPFTDVTEDDWFHDAVLDVYEKGIMEGTGEGKFSPYPTTDRATIVTVLWRLAGSPAAKGDTTFPDVPAVAWYAKAVAWAAEKGIVKGYDTGKFGPTDPITREQLATILWRYSESPLRLEYEGLIRFEDTERISQYAAHAITWAVAEGILTGKDGVTLDPTGHATRAEVATMLMRLIAQKAEG